jgi:hypothetical protein
MSVTDRNTAQRVRRIAGPVLFLLLMANLLFELGWLGGIFSATLDLSFPEGSVTERAWACAHGNPVYTDWREWPHTFAPYGPLTYYPIGTLARWLSHAPSPRSVLLLGRAMSAISLLVIFGLVYFLSRRSGLSRKWALTSMGFVAIWLSELYYCLSFRPDAPATAWTLIALVFVTRDRARPVLAVPALCALMLAMWYKPTAWGAVAATLWWMADGMGKRRACVWGSIWGALGLVAALGLNAYWDGRLLLNLVQGNRQGFSTRQWIEVVLRMKFPEWGIFVFGTYAAIRALRRGDTPQSVRWIARFALLTLASSLALACKAGSDINYLFPPFSILIVLLTFEAKRIWDNGSATRFQETVFWVGVMSIVIVPTIMFLSQVRESVALAHYFNKPSAVVRYLSGVKGPILTTHPFIAADLESAPTVMDFYSYTALASHGLLDTVPLRERIAKQAFPIIVLDQTDWYRSEKDSVGRLPLYYAGCLEDIHRYYTLKKDVLAFSVLEPRKDR